MEGERIEPIIRGYVINLPIEAVVRRDEIRYERRGRVWRRHRDVDVNVDTGVLRVIVEVDPDLFPRRRIAGDADVLQRDVLVFDRDVRIPPGATRRGRFVDEVDADGFANIGTRGRSDSHRHAALPRRDVLIVPRRV